MADCFENIIGFTRTDCPCFTDDDIAEAYRQSNSGLYMDELEETSHILKVVKGIADCGKKMGDLFKGARDGAISSFKEKLFIEMGSRYTVKQNPYTGLVGQNNSTSALNIDKDFVGAAYEMQPLKGGVMKVDKIYVSINQTTAVTVSVYKAYVVNNAYALQGDAIQTIEVNAAANTSTVKEVNPALELPLTDDSGNVVHYLFLMDRSAGFQPLNTKANCGCDGQRYVERWLSQRGVAGNDITAIPTSSRSTAYVNGIVVGADIKCTDTGFVCETYLANPYVKVAIEYAILYEAASKLLENILHSDEINRYALTKREQMKTDAVILHNQFKSRVPWIAENIDMKQNNCFVCNTASDTGGAYKTTIRF